MAPAIYPARVRSLRDLTLISLVTEVPISLAVRADHPARDLADLIAKAKAAPGKYTFASGGVGTGNHLAGELLKKMAGIDLLHVPFRGVAPALTALYAGDIDIVFSSTVETISHARDGRIRVLGVGTPQRIPGSGCRRSATGGGLCDDQLVSLFGPRGLRKALARLRGPDRTTSSLKGRRRRRSMLLLPPSVARIETEVPLARRSKVSR
jgi:hypothetical protein